MKRTFKNMGLLVKHQRNLKGLSQDVVAKKLGYKNAQFISNCERGLCSIPWHKWIALNRVLNITKDDFKKAVINDVADSINGFL